MASPPVASASASSYPPHPQLEGDDDNDGPHPRPDSSGSGDQQQLHVDDSHNSSSSDLSNEYSHISRSSGIVHAGGGRQPPVEESGVEHKKKTSVGQHDNSVDHPDHDDLCGSKEQQSQQSQQSQQHQPQIRHAGRAHVRGKIRRVWRPRYLELWDNGLVRYYELPACSDIALQADSDWDHVNMMPKYTLAIYHARLLDATAIRDIHVGLPRGSFGFLFRGQRLLHLETNYALTSQVACQPADVVREQRDFLCACSCLEEAQMWVVALQWAAASRVGQMPATVEPWWDVDGDEYPSTVTTTIASTTGLHWEMEPGIHEKEATSLQDTASVQDRGQGSPLRKTAPQAKRQATIIPSSSKGKVVVTKVCQYRVVRLQGLLDWEIAYEIHGMLLRGRVSEQWVCLRTADDFSDLIMHINKEVGPLSSLDRGQLEKIQQLPKLRQKPGSARLQASLSTVDSILRSLTADVSMVNSRAMKVFLGLATHKASSSSSVTRKAWSLIKGHDPSSNVVRATYELPNTLSTDQYVKEWMLRKRSRQQSTIDTSVLFILQRPRWAAAAAGVTAVAAMPLARLWFNCMPAINIRLDYLVVSWMSAAYIGRTWNGDASTGIATTRDKAARRRSVATVVRRPATAKREKPPHKENTAALEQTGSHDSHSGVMVKAGDVTDIISSEMGSEGDRMIDDDEESDGEVPTEDSEEGGSRVFSSPLPEYSSSSSITGVWSQPTDVAFHVRGINYLQDRVKVQSDPPPLRCRGVDVFLTNNPERHIARHPAVLDGKLGDKDTFLVNFLCNGFNFCAYFDIPPLREWKNKKLRNVWTKFLKGDQQYRDARLKLLPVVVDGPWIVKAAVGPGNSPALLGKVIPLQYFFREPDKTRKGVYEVDVIITASTIASGILAVVKGHTKSVSIAFAFIIEAAEQEELPETVLCSFQSHYLDLSECPHLPECDLDGDSTQS